MAARIVFLLPRCKTAQALYVSVGGIQNRRHSGVATVRVYPLPAHAERGRPELPGVENDVEERNRRARRCADPGWPLGLVSTPFVGPGGGPSEDIKPSQDLGAQLPRATPIYLYHGSEDVTAHCAHVDLYQQAIPQARVQKLAGRDHQLNDDLSEVAADIRRVA